MPAPTQQPSDELSFEAAKETILSLLREKTLQTASGNRGVGCAFMVASILPLLFWVVLWEIGVRSILLFWLALFGCGFLFRAGLSLQSRTAIEAVERANKLPVLFLRSFEFDEWNFWDVASFPWIKDFQYTLIRKLRYRGCGPILSVGPPGRARPSFRSPRVYIPDENWQEVVGQLMTLSRGIVIMVGESRGLLWEITEAVRRVRPNRLLLVFGQKEQAQRVVPYLYLQGRLPVTLPPPPKKFRYLTFDEQWRPHFSKYLPYQPLFR